MPADATVPVGVAGAAGWARRGFLVLGLAEALSTAVSVVRMTIAPGSPVDELFRGRLVRFDFASGAEGSGWACAGSRCAPSAATGASSGGGAALARRFCARTGLGAGAGAASGSGRTRSGSSIGAKPSVSDC